MPARAGRLLMTFDFWKRLVDISASDPDDARRRRLLSIILLGLMGAVVVMLLFLLIFRYILDPHPIDNDDLRLWATAILAFLGFGLLYWIGRRWSGRVASLAFLGFMIAILLVSDSPKEVVSGRSTYYAVLPIIMASMLFRPSASFHMAGLVIAIHLLMARWFGVTYDIFSPLIFGLTALLSWLSAHSLEQALHEARALNRELDQRVVERTQDLHAALLREQAEAGRSQAILHSIGDSVLVFDLADRLMVANPAYSRLVGRPIEDLLGQPVEAFFQPFPPEQRVRALALYQARDEDRALQVDWGQRVLSLRVTPVCQSAGQTIGAAVALNDITREVEVGRMKSMFVSMVSHELRTPLGAILGLVEMLQYNLSGPLNEKQADLIRRVRLNVNRLAELVNDLLDHAKIEAGTLTIEPEPFSPADLIQEVTEALEGPAQARGLALLKQVDPGLPPLLMGDRRRLHQIVTNLAGNAIKFTEQGRVQVSCLRTAPDRWALQVEDTGIGISPEAQQQIFEPFWQVDASAGRKRGGAGLGLSIVRRLAALMNAEIHLESHLGGGSIFTVSLPLIEPFAAPEETPEERPAHD